ncbi:MAG: hypothetical protein AB7E80_08140 [Hyphomicrobiaceae bacterium]
MIDAQGSSWRLWLLPVIAALVLLAAIATWFLTHLPEPPQRDCSLTPAAHHNGTFVNWRLSMSPGEGMSGEVSALVRLADGREVVAYNVTNAGGLTAGSPVVVSEIQCVHRRVFLITTSGE